MTKAKKITLLISIILIVIGVILYAVMGFNYNLSYGTAKRIIVPMKDDFVLDDYKSIAKDIYGENRVETISIFREGVSIKVKDTNDEQLDALVSKVNEKYGYEYKKEDLEITELSKVEVFNILKQVFIPIITTLLVVFVYMMIRYRKLNLLNVVLNLLVPVILAQLVTLTIYLICRIPVTNMLLPVLLTVYVVSVIYSAKQLEDRVN